MSYDNYYKNRKDRRKSYRDSRVFDRSCRNHGDCPWCRNNRTFGQQVNDIDPWFGWEDVEHEED